MKKGKEVTNIEMTDIYALSTVDGIKNLIGDLKSNTTYNIEITAKQFKGSKKKKNINYIHIKEIFN